MFNLRITCINNDILSLLLKDSDKITQYFSKAADELKFSDITEYYAKHRNEQIVIKEL